jgi:hypothetical protein
MTAVNSICRAAAFALLLGSTVAHAAGDLSRQEPIEVAVDLGQPGQARLCAKQASLRDRQALQACIA